MHSVVTDQPYEFVPPYRGKLWPRMLLRLLPWRLNHSFGIESVECEGIELIKDSLAAGNSVIIAPNHCRPADPLIAAEVCRRAGSPPFTMASWHLFREGWLQRFILRSIGAFSVYREGLDRQALHAAIEILEKKERPLILFPEGVITRTNDRLVALMDGVSFIARSAAKKRALESPPGKVVVHPLAIRYKYHGDIDAALHETLDAIEQRLSWRPKREPDRVARIYRVGEALLWLKEIEYLGEPKYGDIPKRLDDLIDHMLVPKEDEWLSGKSDETVVARVKLLRTAIIRDMIDKDLDEEERTRRWDQLADLYLAQQLSHYAPEYVRSNPTPERLLETVEKFEEDLTDCARIHRPMSATVRVGTAIEVSPKRVRGGGEDPVMIEIDQQLKSLLGIEDRKSAEMEKAGASD